MLVYIMRYMKLFEKSGKIEKSGKEHSMYRRLRLPLCVMAVLLLSSCAARISGQLDTGGAGNFTLNAGLKPRLSTLIKSFQALAGGGGALIIDGPQIAESFSRAPGIASVSLRNTSPAAIEGPVNISQIGDFLASGNAAGFIRFERGDNGQGGRCAVSIRRDMGPQMLSLISPEIADYLAALMAPIATGEDLGKAEYLAAVASIYGKAISDEIAESSIIASIDFPGTIQSVKNGTFNGRRAEFAVPLLDLLVLETPLTYEVVWK